MGGALASVASMPVRINIELLLCALFLFQLQSVLLLVLIYVAAAERYDETNADARTELWSSLYFALNFGVCCGVVVSSEASARPGSALSRWILPAGQAAATLMLAGALAYLFIFQDEATRSSTSADDPHHPASANTHSHNRPDSDKGDIEALSTSSAFAVGSSASFNELGHGDDGDGESQQLTINPSTLGSSMARSPPDILYSEVRKIGSVLADASRRRLACATPIAAMVASIVGFACNVVAWATFTRATKLDSNSCRHSMFCRDDGPLNVAVFGLTTASCTLLGFAAFGFLRCSSLAGYLEACKKQHGGNFEERVVEGAKDVLLLAPFVGLCILYTALFEYALGFFAAQATHHSRRALHLSDDDDTAEVAFGSAVARAVVDNYDSFLILGLLPLTHFVVQPALERERSAPIRPIQKLVASGVLVTAAFAFGTLSSHLVGAPLRPCWIVQLPQYLLLAAAEIYSIPTFYEVFYAEMPPDLRIMSMSLYMYAIAVGNTLGATARQIATDPLWCGAFALVATLAGVAAWWLCAGASYIYRQDREWVVAQAGRRNRLLHASSSSPASSPRHSSLRRSRVGPPGAADGEIVAVLRGIFSGLEAQYLIPFSLLKMGRLVASGGSGQVWKGRYAGVPVAIKSLYSQMMDPDYVSEVRHEARMLAAVRHPHITQFHGISRFENRLLLVTEFVPISLDALVRSAERHARRRRLRDNRNRPIKRPSKQQQLHDENRTTSASSETDVLDRESHHGLADSPALARPHRRQHHAPRPDKFSVEDARRIWVELAQTLIYLHSTGLAHRDIKPSNMLLEERDGRYHLKLCDLGMARFSPLSDRSEHGFVTLGAGTPAYSPPESYRPSARPRGFRPRRHSGMPQVQAADIDDLSKWDVFSFATVIWYTWHCTDPFPGLSVPEVCMAVTRGERPEFDPEYDAPDVLIDLVTKMWHQLPAQRPTAAEILAVLQSDELTKNILHIAFKQAGNDAGTALRNSAA